MHIYICIKFVPDNDTELNFIKEKFIVKRLIFAACAAVLAAAVPLASCNSGEASLYKAEVSDGELVVFVAPEVSGDMSVKDYFDGLVEEGVLTYTIADGMVTSINGVQNPADYSYCWMFYSDLTELDGVIYSNAEWGTYDYEGKTLASCAYGVEEMPVVEGYTYAAVYQSLSY